MFIKTHPSYPVSFSFKTGSNHVIPLPTFPQHYTPHFHTHDTRMTDESSNTLSQHTLQRNVPSPPYNNTENNDNKGTNLLLPAGHDPLRPSHPPPPAGPTPRLPLGRGVGDLETSSTTPTLPSGAVRGDGGHILCVDKPQPVLSCPISSHPIAFHQVSNHSNLSHPIISHHITSHLIPFHPIP